MSKNFFRKLIESSSIDNFFNSSDERDDKSHDFERAKDVLFSAKNLEQLVSAVKYINNFNKKHKIRETSPEFIYFEKMINVMKIKLRSRKKEVGNDSEESERMDLRGRIRESFDDLDWIKDTQPIKVDFNFDEKEYWVDVSKIDREGREKIVNHIKKTVPNYEEFEHDLFGHISRGNYKGIIVHCGSDRTDFEPEENLLCSAGSGYEDDYEIDNPYADISKSIYVDGQDILNYLTVVGDEEELEESLEWSDKDAPFDEKDKSFESDPSWKNDEDWSLNPERSYWKQGDAGGSGGGDMNESDDFDWVRDVKTNDTIAKEIYEKLNWYKVPNVTTDFIEVPWVGIAFAVKKRTQGDSKIPLITPNTFYKGFTKYMRENYGLFLMPDIRKVYDKIKELMGDKIHGDMNESNDLQWISDIKSNKDIAEELFNQTVITKDKGIVKLPFTWTRQSPKKPYFDLSIRKKYGEDKDSDDIWKRYKILVNNRLKELTGKGIKESNDMEWIKDVKPDKLSASPDVFFRSDDDMFYTLDQLGHDSTNMTEITMAELATNYGYRWSEEHEGWYHRDEVADFTKLNESDDFEWIKNVPDTIPSISRRNKISLKDFLVDIMKDDVDLLHHLVVEDHIVPTQEYIQTGNGGEGFTPEDWDDFGFDEWAGDGHWVDNHRWIEDPQIWQHEIREAMELTDGVWKMVEWDTTDYDLERGTHQDRMVFKRKSDGAYFALNFSGSHYDGIEDWLEELYQVFPKQITRFIYESNKKIMFEGDMSWIEDIEPHPNYEGHPQGIVLLRNHQEIDEFCDIIDNYNGGITNQSDDARHDLHQGLENRKGELEEMSAEDGEDYGEAILSCSFFVERRRPNKLTVGYWPYDVTTIGQEININTWLDGNYTFNEDYQIYKNLNQLKTIFKNYKNPVL
jgi:hypothetical protein